MRTIWMAIVVIGTIAQTGAAQVQCGEAAKLCKCETPPRLSIKNNVVTVSGQVVHLSGSLPSNDERWFYSVTCHTSSRLFNFSLWTISKIHDHHGYYFAKSWNLQIMDSHYDQEREILFDRENEFYFWGDAVEEPEGTKVRITSILGLPEGIHGDAVLREIRREAAEGDTSQHVGYSDWWNFDPKPAGARSKTGEFLVDAAAHLRGKPFLVLYGTTPPPSTIPRN